MKCVHHMGCSSAAVSGNVVKFSKVRASEFTVGKDFMVRKEFTVQ